MEEIIKKCKCGVYLTINENRDIYQSVADRIKEINEIDFDNNGGHDNYEPEIGDELAQILVEANCICELQFYPNTPIGFYKVYGASLKEVINQAKEILEQINQPTTLVG